MQQTYWDIQTWLQMPYEAKSVVASNVLYDLCHLTLLQHHQPPTWLASSRLLKVVGWVVARRLHLLYVWTRNAVLHLGQWSELPDPNPSTVKQSQPAGSRCSCREPSEVIVMLGHRGLCLDETCQQSTCSDYWHWLLRNTYSFQTTEMIMWRL